MVFAVLLSANAADLAILRNGNSIRHQRRQIVGTVTRLYLGESASGYVDIPTDQILRFEVDTAPPPAPPTVVQPNSQPKTPVALPISQTSPVAISKPASLTPAAPTLATLHTPPANRAAIGQAVDGAGERHQLDPDFINSVIRAESAFNSRAVSKKGAQGLMQLMPQTANQLGVTNPFDPNANVEGGTKYLRELLEKYNFDVVKALAAYNAGPKRVDRYRGVPPYYETQTYIAKIIRDFNRQKIAQNPALAKKPTTKPATKFATKKPHTAGKQMASP
jgi:hypothetical protein